MTLQLTPLPTDPMDRARALTEIGWEIGIFAGAGESLDVEELPALQRLALLASTLVEHYAPGAPQAVRNEAVIRCAGALRQSDFGGIASESIGGRDVSYFPQPAGGWSPLRKSGAMALLSPWRVRRAV